MICVIGSLECRTSNFNQLRRVPTVTTNKRNIQTKISRLPYNQADLGVVTGHNHSLWLLRFDCGELCAEVCIAFAVAFIRNNVSAHALKVLSKEVAESYRVIVF